MKLSIITICYNELDVEKTCESIVNQTFQDFEWIVVDGGSNKETLDIFEKYKNRINIFISEKDNGKYDAMNKGIKLASGEFLNFLNAGDQYFYNEALKDVFENKTYSADVLYGHEMLEFKDFFANHASEMPETVDKKFLLISSLRHQAAFIRKELFEKFGYYDENYDVVSDYEKWHIFLNNGVIFQRLPYIVSKFNTTGISMNENTRQIAIAERQEIIKKYYTDKELKTLKRIIKNTHIYTFREKIFSFIEDGDGKHNVLTILGIHIKIRKR